MAYNDGMWVFPFLVLACGDTSVSKPAIDPNRDTGTPTEGFSAPEDSDAPEDTAERTDSGGHPPTDTADDCVGVPSDVSHTLEFDASLLVEDRARTLHNPLKGFMTSYLWGEPITDFPDQMEFLYLPMNTLWDESGDTLEAGLEPYLVAADERGHHAVLRVFVDYPTRPSGLPEYLSDTIGCSPYTEHGGGCSPDYDNPAFLEAMVGLIEAMGARYDGDPRLGFVQLGMLGFWGEWHTWPHDDWFPTEATQNTILNTYIASFATTHLQIRRAAASSVSLRMGFHDDSFAYSTIGETSWFFLPGLVSAGAVERWQEVPIGGELRPELQPSVFSDDYVLSEYAQDINECIEQTHASYLLNYYAFNGEEHGYLGEDRTRAEQSAMQMGYQFEIQSTAANASGLSEDTINLSLDIVVTQTGVAPFYYPLSVSIDSDALETPVVTDTDLHTLLPGDSQSITIDLGRVSADIINNPVHLELTSPMLLPSQRITLATTTTDSPDVGATTLLWSFVCEAEGVDHPLGTTLGTDAHDCPCVCDVDGVFRGNDGEVCG
jgi:hypothetical protein